MLCSIFLIYSIFVYTNQIDHKKNVDKNNFVTMATIKLDDFAYFWVFLGSQTRGSGAEPPTWVM